QECTAKAHSQRCDRSEQATEASGHRTGDRQERLQADDECTDLDDEAVDATATQATDRQAELVQRVAYRRQRAVGLRQGPTEASDDRAHTLEAGADRLTEQPLQAASHHTDDVQEVVTGAAQATQADVQSPETGAE